MSEITPVFPTGDAQHAPSSEAEAPPGQVPSTSASRESADNEGLVHAAVTGLQEALVTEMSGLVGRLVTATVTEADAAVKRARAEAQSTIDEVRAKLNARTRENEAVAQSILEAESQVVKLRLEVEVERERANAARDEGEALKSACARAEAACEEVQAIHHELVSTYEGRLQTLQAELEAASFERAKLFAVLQTVQQTVASSGSGRPASRPPRGQSDVPAKDELLHEVQNRGERVPAGSVGLAPDADQAVARAEAQTREGEALASTLSAARSLKLVPPSQQTPVDAPPQLVEHVKQLLDEIEAMYWADAESAERPAEVVERLTVNVRYAWDLFTRRMASDGGSGAAVFEQQLSALLDAKTATSFGRHLSIAAHQIVARTQAAAAQDCAATAS